MLIASKPQGFSSLSFQNQVRHNRLWHLFALSTQITFLPPIFLRSRPMRREGKMEKDKRRIENASREHVSTYFWKLTPQMSGSPPTLLRRQRSVRVGRPSAPNGCAHPQKPCSMLVTHPPEAFCPLASEGKSTGRCRVNGSRDRTWDASGLLLVGCRHSQYAFSAAQTQEGKGELQHPTPATGSGGAPRLE